MRFYRERLGTSRSSFLPFISHRWQVLVGKLGFCLGVCVETSNGNCYYGQSWILVESKVHLGLAKAHRDIERINTRTPMR